MTSKLSDLDLKEIQREPRGKSKVLHHDKLKPYKGKTKFKWAKHALKHTERSNKKQIVESSFRL